MYSNKREGTGKEGGVGEKRERKEGREDATSSSLGNGADNWSHQVSRCLEHEFPALVAVMCLHTGFGGDRWLEEGASDLSRHPPSPEGLDVTQPHSQLCARSPRVGGHVRASLRIKNRD